VIRGVDVETTHFKGNFPESCAIEACVEPADWQTALPRSPLRGDAHNVFDVYGVEATHVRLQIFPDGGVARLRVYGDVLPDWDALRGRGELDLAAALHGGRVVDSSDMFFGSRNNLIMPGLAQTMADGWETKRRRTPGHDWTVIRLGAPGTILRVEVDTRQFKGNAPAACSVDACAVPFEWAELVSRTALQADQLHVFDALPLAPTTHVRLNIFPDGGVSRLRVFGRLQGVR